MKNTFEFSLHQHHHHRLLPLVLQPLPTDQVLDLSAKRRDSTETRKTTSPSSYEEGSPELRRTPPDEEVQHMIHRHINIPKPPFTPEHAVQYRYNYEHSSPSANVLKNSVQRSPQDLYRSPVSRNHENVSPLLQEQKPFYQNRSTHPDHEDSNDLPAAANISSSSSTASSQKSPSSSNGVMVLGRDGKLSRPFKAYPRDPLALAAVGSILDAASAEKYSVFRKRMFAEIHAANGGNPVVNNPKMRRMNSKGSSQETNNNESDFEKVQQTLSSPSSGNDKDEAYFERRKKNNAAAKKSRDRRRIKEDEIAIRAAFLEHENSQLKFELAAAQKQLAMYTSTLASSWNILWNFLRLNEL